ALAHDPDAQLRFQVALSLGEWDDDRIVAPLADIAATGADDRWTRSAVASAVPRRSGLLIDRLLADHPRPAEALRTLLHDLAAVAAVAGAGREPAEIAATLAALNHLDGPDALPVQLVVLGGLADGTGRRGKQLGAVLSGLPEQFRSQAEWGAGLLRQAAATAA